MPEVIPRLAVAGGRDRFRIVTFVTTKRGTRGTEPKRYVAACKKPPQPHCELDRPRRAVSSPRAYRTARDATHRNARATTLPYTVCPQYGSLE
ncbi:unnamed protein product [Alternaria burnsii]|nr:unnamed protein product [Alternaria burnsii]